MLHTNSNSPSDSSASSLGDASPVGRMSETTYLTITRTTMILDPICYINEYARLKLDEDDMVDDRG